MRKQLITGKLIGNKGIGGQKGHMQCFFKHSWNVLKSKNLNGKRKIDGLLLLNVYFIPILALFSMLLVLYLILSGLQLIITLWFFIPISAYCSVGNFAPFFEVGIGIISTVEKRAQWLIPLLSIYFLLQYTYLFEGFSRCDDFKVMRDTYVLTHTYVSRLIIFEVITSRKAFKQIGIL